MKNIIILIAFLILGAFTEDIYITGKRAVISQQIKINALQRSINYLQTEMIIDYPYICPLHEDDYKYLSSPFGLRDIPAGIYTGGSTTREHQGIDLVGTKHARVIAIANGEVIDRWYVPDGRRRTGHPYYGGMILIKHDNGMESVYAHLSVIYVNENSKRYVRQGQVIGRTGESGLTDGEHLHFEIRKNGIPVQPFLYMREVE